MTVLQMQKSWEDGNKEVERNWKSSFILFHRYKKIVKTLIFYLVTWLRYEAGNFQIKV
jgi:hypothetical protein